MMYSIVSYLESERLTSTRNRLKPPLHHRGAEAADDDEYDHHRAGDEGEHAGGTVIAEQEGDDEAGEDRREPAPRINDADRRPGDLPFPFEAVGEQRADQRPDRCGDRDNEGIGERPRHFDVLRDQK